MKALQPRNNFPRSSRDGRTKAVLSAENESLRRKLDSAQKRIQLLEAQTVTDQFTGLGNKLLFEQDLERACRNQRPFALLQIDMDYLKLLNAILGMNGADDVILQVSKAIRQALQRKSDRVYRRNAGDEFLVLLEGLSLEMTLRIAKEILEKINRVELLLTHFLGSVTLNADRQAELKQLFNESCGAYFAHASIGVAYSLKGSKKDTAEQIQQVADQAQRQAKTVPGKNCIRHIELDVAEHAPPHQVHNPSLITG